TANDLRIGTVIVNRAATPELTPGDRDSAVRGDLDTTKIAAGLAEAGITLPEADFDGLIAETVDHAIVLSAQDESAAALGEVDVPQLSLPALGEGMDLGGLYELAEQLSAQGVR